MPFIRVLSFAFLILGMLAPAAAQQPALTPVAVQPSGSSLPRCNTSMIVGTWQAAFGYGAPIYGTAQNNGFSCPLSIAADGKVTAGQCTLGSSITVSPLPIRRDHHRQCLPRGGLAHLRLLQPGTLLRQLVADDGVAVALRRRQPPHRDPGAHLPEVQERAGAGYLGLAVRDGRGAVGRGTALAAESAMHRRSRG